MGNAQTMADIFAPIQAVYKERVMRDTWGHLAPKRGVIYKGWILLGTNAFGSMNPELLDAEFEDDTEAMGSSPWSYDHINEYLHKRSKQFSPGCVYLFTGTYRTYHNGAHSFSGKFKKIKIKIPKMKFGGLK